MPEYMTLLEINILSANDHFLTQLIWLKNKSDEMLQLCSVVILNISYLYVFTHDRCPCYISIYPVVSNKCKLHDRFSRVYKCPELNEMHRFHGNNEANHEGYLKIISIFMLNERC